MPPDSIDENGKFKAESLFVHSSSRYLEDDGINAAGIYSQPISSKYEGINNPLLHNNIITV